MKKLICSFLFSLGVFVAANAQFTTQGGNNSVDVWAVKSIDANSNSNVFGTINPGTVFSQTTGTTSAFPIFWKAQNASGTCQTGNQIITAPGPGGVLSTCGSSVTYNVTQVGTDITFRLYIN